MPLPKLPTVDLDNVNHRKRARETINNILDHSFDDWRKQTTLEKTNGVTPINTAFPPGHIDRYGGGAGKTAAENSEAFDKALASWGDNKVTISDGLGGTVTTRSGGVIQFGSGQYKMLSDRHLIDDFNGVIIRGMGSRRTTNAIKAPTTILFTGTSTGYGFQNYGNGGRALTIEDCDICYEDSGFTGDVIDNYGSPGLTLRRVRIGTVGTTGGTRIQTARSCLRLTYWEFVNLEDVVFDGADGFIWFDGDRTITILGTPLEFGGSGFSAKRCTFYDCDNDMVWNTGFNDRTITGVHFSGCTFNPIAIECDRAINFDNVEGLVINDSCHFVASDPLVGGASIEWIYTNNCTGEVCGNCFDGISPRVGTFGGNLKIEANRSACDDGFILALGNISTKANEISVGAAYGFLIQDPNGAALCVNLGPDTFKTAVAASYYCPTDDAGISGCINYDLQSDASTSKFSNASDRISIMNVDRKDFSDTSAAITLSEFNTGRTYLAASNSAGQTYTLPTPHPGCSVAAQKIGNQTLVITAGSPIIYAGQGAVKTSLTFAAADIGGGAVFKAIGTSGWLLKEVHGTVAYA